MQAPGQPGPAPQSPPQHLGILGPADNLGFGFMAFSWDIYFSFPTSLGKRLICGGDIFGRSRDGGNRYKAKLLGSYNRSMSSMERFSSEGLLPHPHEGRKIQFPSLVKNHPAECNSPTHS